MTGHPRRVRVVWEIPLWGVLLFAGSVCTAVVGGAWQVSASVTAMRSDLQRLFERTEGLADLERRVVRLETRLESEDRP